MNCHQLKSYVISICLILFLFSCKKEIKEDGVFDQRDPQSAIVKAEADSIYRKIADKIFMTDNTFVELYIQNGSDTKMQKVDDFENVPPNLSASYNLMRNADGNVMYVAEFPFYKKGYPENIYESIFDNEGNLLLFVRQSTFPSDNKLIFEKSEYYYNKNHDLIKKTYQIADGNGKPIPEDAIIKFDYRFPYEKYMTRAEWLKAHHLEK